MGSDRRHDLDALRAGAMLLGIVYHAALSLALGFPWFVQDPSANKVLNGFQAWVHGFRMPLFFIVSGFFTAMLWKKRGAISLLGHRFRRILLPCLVGAFTVVPISNYMIMEGLKDGGKRRLAAVETLDPAQTIWAAIRQSNPAATEKHLEGGFDWKSLHPTYRVTPLQWSAIVGDAQSALAILNRGCDPSIASPDGNTPLHAAMFFGHFETAKLLLEKGADPTKKSLTGETPLDPLRSDLNVVTFIGGLLEVPVDQARVRRGRDQIVAELIPHIPAAQNGLGLSVATNPSGGVEPTRFDGNVVRYFLFDFPMYGHLWFLWVLWWLVVLFVIAQALLLGIHRIAPIPPVPWAWVISPWTIGALVLVTLYPISKMLSVGTLVGPDTTVTVIPAWHVFLYYAIFFFFGIGYYLSDDQQGKLGSSWKILIPLTMLVVFPIALECTTGLFGWKDTSLLKAWGYPLNLFSQSLFAWWMALGCIGLFRNCLASERPWIRYFSDASYWLYIAHLPVVVAFQTWIAWKPYNAYVKLFLITGLCVGMLLCTYQLFVRKTWIGRFLNGPQPNKR